MVAILTIILLPVASILLPSTMSHRLKNRESEHFLEYYVTEEQPTNTFVGNLITDDGLDRKYEPHIVSLLRFTFLTHPAFDRRFFAVDEQSGVIRTTQKIDREKVCPGALECIAQFDVAVKPAEYFQLIKVKVKISDINDNAPEFPEKRIYHQISESAELDSSLAIQAARDLDSGDNGVEKYEIFSKTNKFELVSEKRADMKTDLRLVLKEKLDRETEDRYQIQLIAIDGGDPPRSGSTVIDITVLDANDNNPQFDNTTYEVRVLENLQVGTVIQKVKAKDKDIGPNGAILYEFSRHTVYEYGHLFGIKTESGKIYLKERLDYETTSVHLLAVTATDRGPDSLPAHASVIIRVDDVNDNAPQISIRTLTTDGQAEVLENSPIGTFVAYVSVTDKDSGDNGKVSCTTDNVNFSPKFTRASEFKISTMIQVDRETIDSYQISIACSDNGSPSQSTAVQLKVRILDENDNEPQFESPQYEFSVDENSDVGLTIGTVRADDRDSGVNGQVTYRLDDNVTSVLYIDENTGLIRTGTTFDREASDRWQFRVFAVDRGNPGRSSSALVLLTIDDRDDEKPTFTKDGYVFELVENHPAGVEIGSVVAHDRDSDPFNQFQYFMDPESRVSHLFSVDPVTGSISSNEVFDRERKSQYRFNVLATSNHSTTRTHVIVHVTDTNDNRPTFVYPHWKNESIGVSSQTPIGHRIARLKANDHDSGVNANLSFHISSGNWRNLFNLNPISGSLSVNADLTNIAFEDIQLRLLVQDGGDPPMTDISELRLIVSKDITFVDPEKEFSILAKDGVMAVVLAVTLSFLAVSVGAVFAVIVCIIRRRRLQSKRPPPQSSKRPAPQSKRVNGNADLYSVLAMTGEKTNGQITHLVVSNDMMEPGNGSPPSLHQQLLQQSPSSLPPPMHHHANRSPASSTSATPRDELFQSCNGKTTTSNGAGSIECSNKSSYQLNPDSEKSDLNFPSRNRMQDCVTKSASTYCMDDCSSTGFHRRRLDLIPVDQYDDGSPKRTDPGAEIKKPIRKSPWRSLECFQESNDETKRPVVVFVKDQAKLERGTYNVGSIAAEKGLSNARHPVQPADPYGERYLYHIRSSAAAAAAAVASGSGGTNAGINSHTLPLSLLRHRAADGSARKDRTSGALGGAHHILWPRKNDKIYICKDDSPPPGPSPSSSSYVANDLAKGSCLFTGPPCSSPYTVGRDFQSTEPTRRVAYGNFFDPSENDSTRWQQSPVVSLNISGPDVMQSVGARRFFNSPVMGGAKEYRSNEKNMFVDMNHHQPPVSAAAAAVAAGGNRRTRRPPRVDGIHQMALQSGDHLSESLPDTSV